ncbi:MAG: hypothetical protein DIU78_003910 [Pseudomonadota bacterium]
MMPVEGEDFEALRTLAELRRGILRYPMAVQAAFSALVREGRAFAETPEGAEWKRRLVAAKSTGRARMVWDVISLGAFGERASGPLPTVFLDALCEALRRPRLEHLLARLVDGR